MTPAHIKTWAMSILVFCTLISAICEASEIPVGRFVVLAGGATVYNGHLPHTVIRYGNEPLVILDKDANGSVSLTIRVYSI